MVGWKALGRSIGLLEEHKWMYLLWTQGMVFTRRSRFKIFGARTNGWRGAREG